MSGKAPAAGIEAADSPAANALPLTHHCIEWTTRMTYHSPINYAQLLEKFGDDTELARLHISAFAGEVTGYVDELQSAFDLQETDTVAALAHAIKESATLTAANAIGEAAGDIESAALTEDLFGALSVFSELQTEVIRLQEWLEEAMTAL